MLETISLSIPQQYKNYTQKYVYNHTKKNQHIKFQNPQTYIFVLNSNKVGKPGKTFFYFFYSILFLDIISNSIHQHQPPPDHHHHHPTTLTVILVFFLSFLKTYNHCVVYECWNGGKSQHHPHLCQLTTKFSKNQKI